VGSWLENEGLGIITECG